jgi:hypothetical protein
MRAPIEQGSTCLCAVSTCPSGRSLLPPRTHDPVTPGASRDSTAACSPCQRAGDDLSTFRSLRPCRALAISCTGWPSGSFVIQEDVKMRLLSLSALAVACSFLGDTRLVALTRQDGAARQSGRMVRRAADISMAATRSAAALPAPGPEPA